MTRATFRSYNFDYPDPQPAYSDGCEPTFGNALPADENRLYLVLPRHDYIKLFSALESGAYTMYPEEHLRIVHMFLSGLRCELPVNCGDDFVTEITDSLLRDICACVSEAKNQIVSGQNALLQQMERDRFESRSENYLQPLPDSVLNEQFSTTMPADVSGICNSDNAYAVAVAIVDFFVGEIDQYFEQVEGRQNVATFISEIIDNFFFVPEANDSASDVIDTFIAWDNYGKEAWEASLTPALLDEYYCGIFELIACNGCLYDIDMIINYFGDRVNASFGQTIFDSISSLNSNFVSIVTGGSPIAADLMLAANVRILKGFNLLGLQIGGQQRLIKTFLAARDETNNDWRVHCISNDPCPWVYDWANGDDTSLLAAYDDSTMPVAYGSSIEITTQNNRGWYIDLPDGYTATGFDIDITLTYASSSNTNGSVRIGLNQDNGGLIDYNNGDVVHNISASINPSETRSGEQRFFITYNGAAATITINSLQMRGILANPFGVSS